jgi:hypothetical protein
LTLAAQYGPVLPVKQLIREISPVLGAHDLRLVTGIVDRRLPCFYTSDLDAFSAQAFRDDTFDMIVFVGFNSLPEYYSSHKTVYVCDDFTFRPDITQHSSYTLCQQADAIVVATFQDPEDPESPTVRLRSQVPESIYVQGIQMAFSRSGKADPAARNCLLLDDYYPVSRCNATLSLAKYLAEQGQFKPVAVTPPLPRTVAQSAPYCDPVERRWPAIVVPDGIEKIKDMIKDVILPMKGYDVIVSATADPKALPPLIGTIPVIQYAFSFAFRDVDWEPVLNLPPGAFLRQSRR